ncbi:porin [Paraburkholderia pallida]|uniref:Porin n=1 Tax=Paraburkholderia pallida TaxID=2547399 RepID=A0A4P7D3R9_9BURK|nr:porin [Paraburkholderia pallida]QBR01947.1 porin [Paraburkholderia pallida]
MKLKLVGLLIIIPAASHAQSSVTLYGLVSAGIEVVNNTGGSHAVEMLGGALQPSRLGFRIREDLGGGNAVVAVLENGFDNVTGSLGQGGRLFGRQSWIGIESARWGTLSAGRQYDAMWDNFTSTTTAVGNIGLLDHPGDADNLVGTWRYSNALKYRSPSIGGFSTEAMYAASNAAGEFSFNRAFSFGLSYQQARWRLAAAYVQLDHPGTANENGAVSNDYGGAPFLLFRNSPLNANVGVRQQRNYGVGAYYDVSSKLRWSLLVDQARYSYLDSTGFTLTNYDTALVYRITPAIDATAAYIYSRGSYSGIVETDHWNTASIALGYHLSKQTDVRIIEAFQKGSGQRAAASLYLNAPSTSSTQNVVMVGIRHLF